MSSIDRDGYSWSQNYVDQKAVAPLVKGAKTTRRGTTITFWADATIFETTTYSFETISRRLQEMAFLNKGLTIILRDERVAQIVDEDDETAVDQGGAEADRRKKSPTTTRVASPTSSSTSTRPRARSTSR